MKRPSFESYLHENFAYFLVCRHAGIERPKSGGMSDRLTQRDRARIAARLEVWGSVVEVQRWWRQENGPHATLDPKTVRNCHRKLMDTGSVADRRRSGRPRAARTPANVNAVQDMFNRSPTLSIRQASRQSGLSVGTVHSILRKDLSFRPWKPHYVQELHVEDCDTRMRYGENMLSWHQEWPQLFKNVLWSDEAVFHVGGFVNRHNSHYWTSADPQVTVEKAQSRPKVTVWCGMTDTELVGPVILRDTMNAERYLHMLQNDVWPYISGWNLDQ